MFTSITIKDANTYKEEPGDFVVFVSQTEYRGYPLADYTVWYEWTDIGATQKEVDELSYNRFTWSNHASPLLKVCKQAAAENKNKRLVFVSYDHLCDAAAMAISVSQATGFKKYNLTEEMEWSITPTIDVGAIADFHDLKSKLVKKLKKMYPEETKTYTRYELLEMATWDLVLSTLFESNPEPWLSIKKKWDSIQPEVKDYKAKSIFSIEPRE